MPELENEICRRLIWLIKHKAKPSTSRYLEEPKSPVVDSSVVRMQRLELEDREQET